jgi:hypothetical protein
VADVLEAIRAVPNKHNIQYPGDLQGEFDFWFDGGPAGNSGHGTNTFFETGGSASGN